MQRKKCFIKNANYFKYKFWYGISLENLAKINGISSIKIYLVKRGMGRSDVANLRLTFKARIDTFKL